MKQQKICHDDSFPPYDSYCSYCSRSGGCDSEDFRMVEDSQPDSIHIDEIKAIEVLDDKLKQRAIAFMECKGYDWVKYSTPEGNIFWRSLIEYHTESFTTEQLYQTFLNHQSQNK